MKLRTLLIVAFFLIALSATVFITHRPDSSRSMDPREGQPLADAAVLERATKVRVMDRGKTVTLTQQPDGSWSVTSYFNLPANFTMISGLVGSLVDSRLQRLVTTNTERFARMGFSETQIAFFDSSNKELWSAMLGKNAEGGGRFVRYGTEQKAYLTNFNAGLESESKNWANTELLAMNANDIARVEVALDGASPILFSRANKDTVWTSDQTPVDKKIDDSKIALMLSSIANIHFSETNDLSDSRFSEAKVIARVIKVSCFDGKAVSITFRNKPADAIMVAGEAVSPSAGPIADFTAKRNFPNLNAGPSTAGGAITSGPIPAGSPMPSPADVHPQAVQGSPAAPVFVVIESSDTAAPVNAMMKQRAFQVAGDIIPGVPKKAADFFEPILPPNSNKPHE